MKILFLYNKPKSITTPDDEDILAQVNAAKKAVESLGYVAKTLTVSLDLSDFIDKIFAINPDVVFNLVESLQGIESYMHFVPLMLERNQLKYTGCSSEALYLTTNKILAKELMKYYSIPTPAWHCLSRDDKLNVPEDSVYIIKPIAADASVGLDEDSVVRKRGDLLKELKTRAEKFGPCFAEEFIEGREFNISMLEIDGKPVVLPVAEMLFMNYPVGKERVIGYRSKWDTDSFEYKNTVRNFEFTEEDSELIFELTDIARFCWRKFNLNGYARVDFRVSNEGKPFVLEINANPCISPDAGFAAACDYAGISYSKIINDIIKSAIV